jgi:hypothetical protein
MKNFVLAFCITTFVLSGAGVFAQGLPPPPPQAFYGSVLYNCGDNGFFGVPAGAVIQVRGNNVKLTSTNPIVTTVKGLFGGPTVFEPKLAAQGRLETGQPLYFTVNSNSAFVSKDSGKTWQPSIPYSPGVVTRLTIATPYDTTTCPE